MIYQPQPLDLSSESDLHERLKVLDALIINHLYFCRALEAIAKEIHQQTSVIIASGPTTCGLTTLGSCVNKSFPESLKVALRAYVGDFSWRDFLLRTSIDLKQKCQREEFDLVPKSGCLSDLRWQYEQILTSSEIKLVILDDVNHAVKNLSSTSKLSTNLSYLESLIESTDTIYLLLANTEFLQKSQLFSVRFLCKSHFINLPTYYGEQGFFEFERVLHFLEPYFYIKEEQNLVKFSEYLYQFSLGSIGILKIWLIRAFTQAFFEQAKSIELSHLEKTKPSSHSRKCLVQDIDANRKAFRDISGNAIQE